MTIEDIICERQDMTEWLLHFTRDTERMGARDALLSILVEGVIRPGFAERRSGQRRQLRKTIYGPHAAVCFSEQPLHGFVQYLRVRRDNSAMAGYGILIHKRDVYAAGGLPVIYGLKRGEELRRGEEGYDPSKRILRPEDLTFDLQYRYVVFVPTETTPKDWTHEREWRWPANASIISSEPLFHLGPNRYSGENGVSFDSRVHAFVNNDQDVRWLQEKFMDALEHNKVGQVPYQKSDRKPYSYYWRDNLRYVRIISLDDVRKDETCEKYWRFDEWPEDHKYSLITPDRR